MNKYEWTPPRCSCCKVFGLDECPKKPVTDTRRKNSSSFDALNSVENDDDLGANGENSNPSTTPIAIRIDKLERQILEGNLMLVDEDEMLLYKVDSPVNADSDSEVEDVFNESAGFMASMSLKSGSGSEYATKSLLEKWRGTTVDVDDDYDPYNDDVDGVGMIGDFGMSTNEYSDTHRLAKKYDVYSFGHVLFEVMSGRLTRFKISKDDPELLPDIVKQGYDQRKLNDIIDPMLKKEFDTNRASLIGDRSAESLNIFANIAYRCFEKEVEGRPTMADIVEELEKAYRIHVKSLEQRREDEDIAKVINHNFYITIVSLLPKI
nr:phloem protein 2-like protein [Tanacetum cinerariifolium]